MTHYTDGKQSILRCMDSWFSFVGRTVERNKPINEVPLPDGSIISFEELEAGHQQTLLRAVEVAKTNPVLSQFPDAFQVFLTLAPETQQALAEEDMIRPKPPLSLAPTPLTSVDFVTMLAVNNQERVVHLGGNPTAYDEAPLPRPLLTTDHSTDRTHPAYVPNDIGHMYYPLSSAQAVYGFSITIWRRERMEYPILAKEPRAHHVLMSMGESIEETLFWGTPQVAKDDGFPTYLSLVLDYLSKPLGMGDNGVSLRQEEDRLIATYGVADGATREMPIPDLFAKDMMRYIKAVLWRCNVSA